MKLSAHFDTEEFACHCGCGFGTRPGDVNPALLGGLEILRALCGAKPVIMNSGCRCAAHNAAIGGARNSEHLRGNAADVAIPGMPARDVAEIAADLVDVFRDGGIGRHVTFTHLDVRGRAARW